MSSRRKKKDAAKKKKLAGKNQLKHSSSGKRSSAIKLDKRHKISLLVLAIFTFLTFTSSLDNGFVNWDDDRNIYENELITTLNNENFWENTREIFTSDVIGGYNPLTIFTFALEQKFFGLDQPFYWHLNNLILHLVCVIFVFLIGWRLKLPFIATVILTALFAVHPMRVESVAWLTERKDVLFGAFYFLAMYYYLKGKQEGFRKRDYLIIAIAFLCSLLSKIQAVILPLSLILVDYYISKNATITFKSIIRKAPYFLGSLIIGLLGIHFLSNEGSIQQQAYFGISRIFIGSFSLTVYFFKSLIPYELSPLYPYPSSLDWRFYASIITFIVTPLILYLAYIKKWRVIFFGLGFFLVNVVLLLQIVGAGQGFIADRFTYIPYFGLFFIFAFYIAKFIQSKPKYKSIILGVTAVVIAGYAFMTYQQNKIWENGGTLWTHVLKYYDKSTLPYGNRANFYRDNGLTAQALSDYSSVIRLAPDKPEPYNSRARLYFNFNERDSLLKALENYNKAIELKPNEVEYLVNRGATYAKLNDYDNAMRNLEQAEQLDPNFANIYLNRSVLHNHKFDYRSALVDVTKYLQLKPYNSGMWYEKMRLHNALSQYTEGLEAGNRAVSIDPKGLYFFERAKSFYGLRNYPAAKQDIRTAQANGYTGNQKVVNQILNAN